MLNYIIFGDVVLILILLIIMIVFNLVKDNKIINSINNLTNELNKQKTRSNEQFRIINDILGYSRETNKLAHYINNYNRNNKYYKVYPNYDYKREVKNNFKADNDETTAYNKMVNENDDEISLEKLNDVRKNINDVLRSRIDDINIVKNDNSNIGKENE